MAAFPSDSYEGSFALEAYPRLSPVNHPRQWHLILSLGVTGGVFQHQLLLPTSYDFDSDAPHGFATLTILRPEVRLQTTVGIYLRRAHDGIGISLSPWILLGASNPTSITCSECNSVPSVTGFTQTWGASLSVTPSWGWANEP